MNGVDLATVPELLGHSTTTMTERYSHLSPAHKTRAINILDSAYRTESKTEAVEFTHPCRGVPTLPCPEAWRCIEASMTQLPLCNATKTKKTQSRKRRQANNLRFLLGFDIRKYSQVRYFCGKFTCNNIGNEFRSLVIKVNEIIYVFRILRYKLCKID